MALNQLVVGSLLTVFGMHFCQHDRVPRFITLTGWYIVLPGPSPHANFLNEVKLRQSRVHDCRPLFRCNRVGKETTAMTRGLSTATNHRLRITIVRTKTQENSSEIHSHDRRFIRSPKGRSTHLFSSNRDSPKCPVFTSIRIGKHAETRRSVQPDRSATSNDRGGEQAAADRVNLLESQVFMEPADHVPAPIGGSPGPQDRRRRVDLLVDRAVRDSQQD